MGIVKAAVQSAKSGLADQWLEAIEPADMGQHTLMTGGRKMNRRSQNRRGSKNVITDGSVIHVYENQFMILTDGGKVIDYTGESGYYTVSNSSAPSLFNGDLSEAIEESFDRIRYGGQTPTAQKVYYINLQEIRGIKFGTRVPVNYFDTFYNAELFLRAHGTYSIRITDPLKFYGQVVPRNADQLEVADINDQFLSEFLEAFSSSINQMSADGERISFAASKGSSLGKYMAEALDDQWRNDRGVEIANVGIASISYDETSQKLINMRNEGAMLSDPVIREGYVQGSVARGMESAGSNSSGAMAGFMGMNMGMQSGGSVIGAASAANTRQALEQQGNTWTCSCGAVNTGNFCTQCGLAAPAAGWTCSCGSVNTGNFCPNCGKPRS